MWVRSQISGWWRADPVGLGLGLEVGDGLGSCPTSAKGETPQAAHRRQALGAALVEPDDGRAQRLPSRSTLTIVARWVVRATPATASGGDRARLPQPLAGLAQRRPVELGVLLGPAGMRRDVGLELDPLTWRPDRPVGRRAAPARSACRCRSPGCGRRSSWLLRILPSLCTAVVRRSPMDRGGRGRKLGRNPEFGLSTRLRSEGTLARARRRSAPARARR